jgi:hypothetical protein
VLNQAVSFCFAKVEALAFGMLGIEVEGLEFAEKGFLAEFNSTFSKCSKRLVVFLVEKS